VRLEKRFSVNNSMKDMLRNLAGFAALVVTIFVVSIYVGYGELEPCRVLAVEKARRQHETTPQARATDLETWTRVETSQMRSGQCVSGLLDSWGGRLKR
jgi:hypothetical protein